ncbi:hypothetical protein [uncultured Vibrio sp.]|uniref:hypothetical protein n=1 Tax=uncultured Vibrio sp. TaxID=114054 RepID=UPI00091B07D3|nr:hypothetical protein [uncultured Vibrio sp.]OIQ26778.1 MAG: hypothetical protein BM561_01660 [Vibrio sp. MedPE-SWchi]
MKRTRVFLAISAVLVLGGCSDDDNSGVESQSQTSTYKAIDGYLIDADIYVDRNRNGAADSTELLENKTNDNGEFTLEESDKNYPIIIKAIAGQTYDSDKGGRLAEGFEFIAQPGIDIVSPFSTIAFDENLSLDALAGQFNLPSSVVSGDYVHQKSESEYGDSAAQVHALARALTQVIGDSSSSDLINTAQDIKNEIDSDLNAGKDLNKLLYKVGSGGAISTVAMPKTLKEHFLDETFYYVHTNKYQFIDEGIIAVDFYEATQTFTAGSNAPRTSDIQYYTKGFKVGSDNLDEVIYISEDITILVTGYGELGFMTKKDVKNAYTNTYQDAVEADYRGKTYYHFWDDSSVAVVRPSYVELTFSAQGNTVDLTENGLTRTLNWTIQGNDLVVLSALDGNDWTISRTTIASEDFIIFNAGRESNLSVPYFMTEHKALAEAIYSEWTK